MRLTWVGRTENRRVSRSPVELPWSDPYIVLDLNAYRLLNKNVAAVTLLHSTKGGRVGRPPFGTDSESFPQARRSACIPMLNT